MKRINNKVQTVIESAVFAAALFYELGVIKSCPDTSTLFTFVSGSIQVVSISLVLWFFLSYANMMITERIIES